jgi:hypothetical protein
MILAIGIGWLCCGFAAAAIAHNRGANGCAWFAAGALLGPFGILFAAILRVASCPYCRSSVHPEAVKCPKCQSALVPDSPAVQRVKSSVDSEKARKIAIGFAVVIAAYAVYIYMAVTHH